MIESRRGGTASLRACLITCNVQLLYIGMMGQKEFLHAWSCAKERKEREKVGIMMTDNIMIISLIGT